MAIYADAMTERLLPALGILGIPWQRVERLSGDVSSRQYHRVWGPEGTLIACLYPAPFDETEPARQRWRRLCAADPSVRLAFASDPVAYVETTGWFLRTQIPVPMIRGVVGSRGCIVVDDAGDESLELGVQTMDDESVGRAYDLAVDYVLRLQGTTAEGFRQGILGCELRLDSEKLGHELGFLGRSLHAFLPGVVSQALLEALHSEWEILARAASPTRMVLCHRDYHARNLFIHDGTLVVLDHQDLRLGSPFYDIGSLLWDPYVDLPSAVRDQLLESAGIPLDAQAAAVICQRLLKALGTYLNVLHTRPSPTFFNAARRVLSHVGEFLPRLQTPLPATETLRGALWTRLSECDDEAGVAAVAAAPQTRRQGDANGGQTEESG